MNDGKEFWSQMKTYDQFFKPRTNDLFHKNQAGYTAQDAPSTRLKITRDGRTDTTSYRDATARRKGKELKIE